MNWTNLVISNGKNYDVGKKNGLIPLESLPKDKSQNSGSHLTKFDIYLLKLFIEFVGLQVNTIEVQRHKFSKSYERKWSVNRIL